MSDQSKKKPILQLLISTKGKKNFNFLDEMFHKCDADQFSILLVDQTNRETNFKPFHKNIRLLITIFHLMAYQIAGILQ